MRLFLAAVTVVTLFIGGDFLIRWLLPFANPWLTLTLAFAWFLGSIFAAWLIAGTPNITNSNGKPDRTIDRARVRDYLSYLAIALMLVAIVIGLANHDADRGLHRRFKNDWIVGFGSACIVFGYAIKAFWGFRKKWRMWAAMAGLLTAFIALVIPMLSRIDRVPLVLMTPLIAAGAVIVQAVLNRVVAERSDGNRE